jgi:hypothetical protein
MLVASRKSIARVCVGYIRLILDLRPEAMELILVSGDAYRTNNSTSTHPDPRSNQIIDLLQRKNERDIHGERCTATITVAPEAQVSCFVAELCLLCLSCVCFPAELCLP